MISKNIVAATLIAASTAFISVPAIAAEKFKTDQGHTEVLISWNHAGVSIQTAEFEKADGTLSLDEANPENSSIDMTIDVASISSGYEALDTHLKSADFLNVEKFPTATFKSTSVTKTGEKTADIVGEFTLHGVTKPITLNAEMTHIGDHPVGKFLDYYKGKWVAFSATTTLDHQAFGVGSYSTGPITVKIVTEMKEAE
ncbi:MAG: YceI family protein [Pseudomonadota bacterium]